MWWGRIRDTVPDNKVKYKLGKLQAWGWGEERDGREGGEVTEERLTRDRKAFARQTLP